MFLFQKLLKEYSTQHIHVFIQSQNRFNINWQYIEYVE